MWFLGLLIGMWLGAVVGRFEGAVGGALLGAAAGLGLRQLMRRQDAKASEGELQQRVTTLEQRLRTLERRLATLETSGAAVAPVPPPIPEPFTAVAAAPEPATIPAAAEPAIPVAAPEAPATAPRPRPARRPAPAVERQPNFIWRWFTDGNTVVRVGVVLLFIGIAFALKYAYEHTFIPIEARLTGVCAAAIVLLLIGWRVRQSRPGYALAMQGGGVGVFYLTVFAAFRLYHVLPPEGALALLFATAVLSAVLAVLQDAQSMAALGASGGFLAPILASTGEGSHVMLFGYYAMLDAGILGIAWFKAWRPLNVLGFGFTFGIGTLWGAQYYRPELLSSTEPFLLLFFAMYLAVPILFARRQAPELKRYVDGTLVFGTPLVAFGLQARLVHEVEYGAAFSAIGLSLIYLLLARRLFTRHRDTLRMLVEAFLALGVVFATLAVPLALDGRWTSATWALEGAAIVWNGVRQDRRIARAFGLCLQLLAGLAFLAAFDSPHGDLAVLNSFVLGCAFIAVAALFSNWFLARHADRLHAAELAGAKAAFFWGLAWWVVGALHEIWVRLLDARPHAVLLFVAATSMLFSLLHRRIEWRLARLPAIALLPLLMLVMLGDMVVHAHPLQDLGLLAWPVAFAAAVWIVRRHDEEGGRYIDFLHAGQMLLLVVLCSWELNWAINDAVRASRIWGLIAWALVPALAVAGLSSFAQRLPWPVRGHIPIYMMGAAAPLTVYLCGWIVVTNALSDGTAQPLPYVPVINPLDLAHVAAWLTAVSWIRAMRRLDLADYAADNPLLTYGAIGAVAFVALNGMLLRALHHFADVPYRLHAMLSSMLVQSALSIFWTALALCAMVIASRMRVRSLWLAGAGLMAVVVAKLFLIDLFNIGGIARIVSFIGVAVLMLVIGYVSPVPPRKVEAAQ
jgi:uncharacterized membrane protein